MTGFLCLGLMLVTVLTWFLRKRLERGWLFLHRGTAVLLWVMLAVHIWMQAG